MMQQRQQQPQYSRLVKVGGGRGWGQASACPPACAVQCSAQRWQWLTQHARCCLAALQGEPPAKRQAVEMPYGGSGGGGVQAGFGLGGGMAGYNLPASGAGMQTLQQQQQRMQQMQYMQRMYMQNVSAGWASWGWNMGLSLGVAASFGCWARLEAASQVPVPAFLGACCSK